MNGPVFIGGLERTGTSLLYALLASHPRIAMTRRTNWWTFFDGRYGDLRQDRNVDRCLDAMRRYRRHIKLGLDQDRLRREFMTGERTYCRLFALMQEQHAQRLNRQRWGDKSLNTERYAETVFNCFPDARIVHLIRDPRDRYASVLRRWKSKRGGIGTATAAWLGSVQLGENNEARYPGRYRIVRYETLVHDPQETLRELCGFIGEPYEPAMLGMSGAEEFRASGGNSSFGAFAAGEISARSVGRFRDVLSTRQIAFVQREAADVMQRHGYFPAAVELARIDKLQYTFVTVPANIAKMVLWRAREQAYNITGRAPSEHTLVEDSA